MSFYDKTPQEKLEYLREMLTAGDVPKALAILQKDGCRTPELKNALGVCLMRDGKIDQAMQVLRELVFGKLICIPSDTPPLYQANYATVLLCKQYNQVAIGIIRNLPTSAHPYIVQLRWCIGQWQKKLPFGRRMLSRVGFYPAAAIPLTMPPGDL